MSSVPPPNWQPSAMPGPEPPARDSARRARPKLIVALVTAGLLAAGAFALFGSSATKLTDPVAQAATVSSNAAGYRVHMSLDLSSSGTPSATGVGDGRVDLRDHFAAMSMVLDFGSNSAATQALGGGKLTIDEILDGTNVYMKLPAAAMPVLGAAGKPWVKFDLATIGHLPGLRSIGSNAAAGDPSQMLKLLRSVSSGVVAEGNQRVDGVETTLYHADLNLDQIANALPAADQQAARAALAGAGTLPIDVWIDAAHLVRRMQMTFDATLSSGQSLHFGMTADISDYGPQPRPALPPAADVQDISALTSAG